MYVRDQHHARHARLDECTEIAHPFWQVAVAGGPAVDCKKDDQLVRNEWQIIRKRHPESHVRHQSHPSWRCDKERDCCQKSDSQDRCKRQRTLALTLENLTRQSVPVASRLT